MEVSGWENHPSMVEFPSRHVWLLEGNWENKTFSETFNFAAVEQTQLLRQVFSLQESASRPDGSYPPVIKHGVLENGPFINDFPIQTSIHRVFSIAMFEYRRVRNSDERRIEISLNWNHCEKYGSSVKSVKCLTWKSWCLKDWKTLPSGNDIHSLRTWKWPSRNSG